MGPADVMILLVVLALLVICVRSIAKGMKGGECSDCAMGPECSGHAGGSCAASENLIANAEAAVNKMEAKRKK